VVTIESKDVGEVREKIKGSHQWTLEEGCENYIKKEMRYGLSK